MIYASSDWHGVPLSVMQSLLEQADFGGKDTLYVLGDVIDRGEHGIELLRWLMTQPNIKLIRGNHEEMLLRCAFLFEQPEGAELQLTSRQHTDLQTWQLNGGEPTLHALYRTPDGIRRGILDYLRQTPLYADITVDGQDYVLVHGGLENYAPHRRLTDYTVAELLWARPLWNTQYSHRFITVLGHTPTTWYGSMYRGRMVCRPSWWDIDTGAAGGGTPMLLCLDNRREYYGSCEEQ